MKPRRPLVPRANICWTRVGAVVVASWLSFSTCGADPVQGPEIVTQNGQEVLLLPDSLQALIGEQYPGFRVPDRLDVQGLWARIKVPGMFPFVATADFNGDGLKDVSLILLSDSTYKIVIFEKTATGYTAAFDIGSKLGPTIGGTPFYQRLIISVIEKGEDFEQGSFRFRANNDSIMVGILEIDNFIIAYKDGKYEDIVFGSSL